MADKKSLSDLAELTKEEAAPAPAEATEAPAEATETPAPPPVAERFACQHLTPAASTAVAALRRQRCVRTHL